MLNVTTQNITLSKIDKRFDGHDLIHCFMNTNKAHYRDHARGMSNWLFAAICARFHFFFSLLLSKDFEGNGCVSAGYLAGLHHYIALSLLDK